MRYSARKFTRKFEIHIYSVGKYFKFEIKFFGVARPFGAKTVKRTAPSVQVRWDVEVFGKLGQAAPDAPDRGRRRLLQPADRSRPVHLPQGRVRPARGAARPRRAANNLSPSFCRDLAGPLRNRDSTLGRNAMGTRSSRIRQIFTVR